MGLSSRTRCRNSLRSSARERRSGLPVNSGKNSARSWGRIPSSTGAGVIIFRSSSPDQPMGQSVTTLALLPDPPRFQLDPLKDEQLMNDLIWGAKSCEGPL